MVLIRVGSPVAAIGELSRMSGGGDGIRGAAGAAEAGVGGAKGILGAGRARGTAVVVGWDVIKKMIWGKGGGNVAGGGVACEVGGDRLARFVAGLRYVEPGVRVVGMAGAGIGAISGGSGGGGFDVIVPAESDAGVVGRAIRGEAVTILDSGGLAGEETRGRSEESVDEGGVDLTDSVADMLSPVMTGEGEVEGVGDRAVLEGLICGADIRPLCLKLIESRMGLVVRFVETRDEAVPEGPCAAVVRDGVRFGWLAAGVGESDRSGEMGERGGSGAEKGGTKGNESPGGSGEQGASAGAVAGLCEHAAWLGGWLYLRELHIRLRRAAFTDPLTGAWNRRYFDRFLTAAIGNARGHRRNVTLLVFDIDNFKSYNDSYGHGAGDEILVEAVRLMRSVIRPTDRVCRIGGDEFAVVFHDPHGAREPGSVSNINVREVAERFRVQLAQHRFPKLSSAAPGTLTISGGMASFPWDGTGVAELLARADQLAMEAKAGGKNCITFGRGTDLLG